MLNENIIETVCSSKVALASGMLNLDSGIIWTFINIILLFLLLRIFLFKPINKVMDERNQKIQNDIDAAKKAKEEAEELKKQYNDTLKTAKDKAHGIVSEAVERAEDERKAILQKAEDEAQDIFKKTSKTIEIERKRSVQEAQTQIADLAIAAASKILGENVDDEANRKLVDYFLAEEGADKQ